MAKGIVELNHTAQIWQGRHTAGFVFSYRTPDGDLAQRWAVRSGFGFPPRAAMTLGRVDEGAFDCTTLEQFEAAIATWLQPGDLKIGARLDIYDRIPDHHVEPPAPPLAGSPVPAPRQLERGAVGLRQGAGFADVGIAFGWDGPEPGEFFEYWALGPSFVPIPEGGDLFIEQVAEPPRSAAEFEELVRVRWSEAVFVAVGWRILEHHAPSS